MMVIHQFMVQSKNKLIILKKKELNLLVIPGVTAFLASAAALGTQLTLPGVTQTIIVTRAESRTKVPKREKISELAKHKATLIFYLSVHLLSKLLKKQLKVDTKNLLQLQLFIEQAGLIKKLSKVH